MSDDQSITIADLTVALVEPSPTQHRIIEGHLTKLGVRRVFWYQDGKSAFDGIRREFPDLVISAMHLPDITGVELAQMIRNEPTTADTLFMTVSSETSFRYLEPLKQAGVVAILPKPFAPSDLRSALTATVDFLVPDHDALADIDLDQVRVLVVDDSVTARHHIARVMKNMGIHDVVDVPGGESAIRALRQQFYDLVVTDYNMPEMDGQELTRYIREQSTQRSVPILMVTSESDASRLAQVQRAGVSAVCDKPFEPASIKDLVRKMLADR
jgi:two-component system chemotaxis response regulator CheY